MDACYEGLESAVRRLCQVPGIDVNCTDTEDGFTAAMFAVDCNHVACVQVRHKVIPRIRQDKRR